MELVLYTGAILAGALAGGSLPLLGRSARSDLGLSFSAGVMLGAAFLHMLPEAMAGGGERVVPFVLVGFLALHLLERFVLVHLCAEPGPNARLAARAAAVHGTETPQAHVHGDGTGCDVHTMGLTAFVGMSLHTAVDGFALGAATASTGVGFLVFLAILAHKVPSSFSLSAILRDEGWSRGRTLAMNAVFALMVPVGAGIYLVAARLADASSFTAYALAASAGTFLHLALSDILPDLHRRGGSRLLVTGAMLAGIGLMWALRFLHAGH
jgi:zinc and cadmium transporter